MKRSLKQLEDENTRLKRLVARSIGTFSKRCSEKKPEAGTPTRARPLDL